MMPPREKKELNRSSRRKRGMASNPLFIMLDFFCIFLMNFATATYGLKEMGKLLWEDREKGLPDSQKGRLVSQPSQTNFSFPSNLR